MHLALPIIAVTTLAALAMLAPSPTTTETGAPATGVLTYIGVLDGAKLRNGRTLRTPRVQLAHVQGRGLVTAATLADLDARRFLALDRSRAHQAAEVHYYRDRTRMGHPIPEWFHETEATLITPTGAVSSPTAQVCDIAGDFICGG